MSLIRPSRLERLPYAVLCRAFWWNSRIKFFAVREESPSRSEIALLLLYYRGFCVDRIPCEVACC